MAILMICDCCGGDLVNKTRYSLDLTRVPFCCSVSSTDISDSLVGKDLCEECAMRVRNVFNYYMNRNLKKEK